MDIKQTFILGAPRSGTTFLASLLEDTKYGAPYETHFITKCYQKLDQYGELNDRTNFEKLIKDILSERAVMQWKLDIDIDEFYRLMAPDYSYGNIVSYIMALKRNGSEYWGDKTPNYLEHPEVLQKVFPDSKFIFIVRDGRDVALSLLRKPWGPNSIMECGRYWARLNSNYLRFRTGVPKENLFALKYEDLLADTELHIRAIYRFLNEEIDDERVTQLAQSVKGDNAGKWRSALSSRQLRIFEAETSEQLAYFGYPIISERPSISMPERIQYTIYEKYKRLSFLFKANVIDGFKIRFLGKEPFNE